MISSRRLLCGASKSAPKAAPADFKPKYRMSADSWAHKKKNLSKKYTGDVSNQYIQRWEHIYYNMIRFFFVHERLIGKDRWGNRFFYKYHFVKKRGEERLMYRRDSALQHQPYGSLPIDDRLWEHWVRGWRAAPPTPEETENFRKQRTNFMGPYTVGNEASEDAIMRGLAHLHSGPAYMQELDPDQEANRFLHSKEKRDKESRPDSPWTLSLVRGDLMYNEEEVETMRDNMESLFRDKYWQSIEMLRHTRDHQNKHPPVPPLKVKDEDQEPEPLVPTATRPDRNIPFFESSPELKTPELEKLKLEVEHLEQQRHRIQKELGISDMSDELENRMPADQGPTPYAPRATSERWKPKCWSEAWGVGSGYFV